MVSENKNERKYKLNTDNLISKNVIELVDKFTTKNNLNKSKIMDGIIDPGIKSIDSIISKMYRKTHLEENHDFSLRDVNDIIRCSIIVDSYNQVIPLIREFRKKLPSLKGYVCENETGYIGVHLSLIINGFNAEIQISTKEGWYAKQAGEEIYQRWRNFDLSREISEVWIITNKEKKKEKIKQLFSLYNLKSIQLSYCKNMFSSLHKYTKLDKLKESINAVLYLNNHNYIEVKNEELKKYNIKIKDIKSKKELLDNCSNYLLLANEAKEDLLNYAYEALNIVRNSNDLDNNYSLTKQEVKFISLKKKYFSMINKEMKNKFKGEFEVNKYISLLTDLSNTFAYNNIDYDTDLIDEIKINLNDKDIVKLEEKVRKDIFCKNCFLSLINANKNN